MADGKPWFYTIRKHRKKSIAAALFAGWLMSYGANKYREYMIRRELCHEAKAFGDKTLPSLRKPRRLTLVFNPASGSGSAETLLKKNAEPILHIAGLDVTIVKTDYEGQIKTLMQYIDPKTDGIIVAGGDGTLLEVVTGLLRRSDQEEISKIPIGVIPLGAHNSLCNRIFANKDATEARRIGNATLGIVKGYVKPIDVMEIKGGEGRSTFAMSKLHWGAFRDANEKEDKFWIVGPFRRKLSYLVAAVKDWPPFIDTILSYPTTSTEVSSDSQQGVMPHGFATTNCESLNQAPQRYLDDEKSCDTISDGWITNPIQTFGLSVEPFRTEDYLTTDGFLRVDVWPSDLSKTEFIQSGWKMEKEEKQQKFQMTDSPRCKSLKLKQLKLEPKDEKTSWFSIDGEPFEARAITITLLPNKLQVFFNPHKILES
ncbi:acylglycerol kinase, mitochondrial-like [Pocillopora damicornis]|uniref:acylglycerol kinase, mitochondrial-like n=1 Tax=Pocillopora damicornis TaxID=46731 RepID=UPI000F55653A|nr:acylglycerol kinase, mitochondrial-like [Pocillopora damicornis]